MKIIQESWDYEDVPEYSGINDDQRYDHSDDEDEEVVDTGNEEKYDDLSGEKKEGSEDKLDNIWKSIVLQADKPVHKWELADLEKFVFQGIEDVDKLYNNYGKVIGFGVRKYEIKCYRVQKML